MISLLGILVLLLTAVLLSSDRRKINKRIVISAFFLQLFIALFALHTPFGRDVLASFSDAILALFDYASAGIDFIFGDLAGDSLGFIFFVQVLPVVVFSASLMSVLYHLHIMQWIVLLIGGFLRKIIGISKVESLCTAANIFLGQTDAPLVVKPYLESLKRSQLFTVMVTGMASVAGTILVAYALLGIDLKYLITASFMAAPGGLLMAKLMYPDDEKIIEGDVLQVDLSEGGHKAINVIEAAANGAHTGLKLAANIGSMLLAFVALIAMLNGLFAIAGGFLGIEDVNFETVLGYIFAPIMFLLGVPSSEIVIAGNFVGQKLILNEFVAYANLGALKDTLSMQTQVVVSFALCGFANFSSLAIQLGGLGSLAPSKKSDIAILGVRALTAATLANLMSAAIASLLYSWA